MPPKASKKQFRKLGSARDEAAKKNKAANEVARAAAAAAAADSGDRKRKSQRVLPPTPTQKRTKASSSTPGAWAAHSTCAHGICAGTSGDSGGRRQLPQGTDRARCLRIMKRTDAFVTSNAFTELRICAAHLRDPQADVTSKNLIALGSDPVFLGTEGKRSEAGEALYAEKHPVRTTVRSAMASGAPSPSETNEQRRTRWLERRVEELELEVAEAGDVLTELRKAPRIFSYDWMMQRRQRVETFSPLTQNQLVAEIELLKAAGAEGAYAAISPKNPLLSFPDAFCIGLVRLYRMRPYVALAEMTSCISGTGSAQRDRLRLCVLAAQEVAVYIGDATTLRPLDFAYREEHRVPCMKGEFGPGGEHGPIVKIYDGLKLRLNATKNAKKHRVLNNSYAGGPTGQTQVGLDSTFRVIKPTFCAAGSYNESACLKAALHQVVDGTRPGECIGTDKGMDMVQMLGPHGLRHVRPTLMASTDEGSGMSAQQGDESRRFSAVRGASEWVVRGHKGFDIFCGRPVQWQEWPNVDLCLQFVTMILQIKGPHSDRTVEGPKGENTLRLLGALFHGKVPLPREAAIVP